MNVLLAVATKHGATHGIADAVSQELAKLGIDAPVRNLEGVHDLAGYDAAILGSAIYIGHPMPVAQHFVDTHEGALTAMPVWLFSSGALGTDHPVPAWPSVEFDRMAERIGAREYRMFAGRLDGADLSLGERIVTRAVHAPEGDFRDWDAIRGWARVIASSLLVVGETAMARQVAAPHSRCW